MEVNPIRETFDPDAHILVVDDNATIRTLLVEVLKKLGFHNIVEEFNGQQALARLQEKTCPFEIVFSDWRMSGLTGLGLLVRMRSDPGLKAISFIMITGTHDDEYVKMATKAGVDGYLLKPFTIADVKEKLSAAFQKALKK